MDHRCSRLGAISFSLNKTCLGSIPTPPSKRPRYAGDRHPPRIPRAPHRSPCHWSPVSAKLRPRRRISADLRRRQHCTKRDLAVRAIGGLARVSDHGLGGLTFGVAIGLRHHRVDDETMAVVRQRVAHEAQLAACVLAFSIELRVRVGRRLMRLVAALLALEVAAAGVVVFSVLALEALVPGPRLDQRPVDAEVLARQPALLLCGAQHLIEELDDRVVLDQALAVLREDRGHPYRVIDGKADEPAEEHVVLRLLHQLTLGADAEQDLQQHRAK